MRQMEQVPGGVGQPVLAAGGERRVAGRRRARAGGGGRARAALQGPQAEGARPRTPGTDTLTYIINMFIGQTGGWLI